ncbi:zinc-ribbon domain-containing protein [Butyrivibrio sp. AD3002]|uniref:zinc-ribbon domain-containing protein n=1 Tax=Butyrivibrio sp. AD3002 TaxID=1280670 RepID=UPI0003B56FCD|nr:zinc ribbon domain-containing protein [Butyrivibrio sp. AD3002]
MPLVKCPDCFKRVSSRAPQCPFCGCPAEFFEPLDNIETENDSLREMSIKNTSTEEPNNDIISQVSESPHVEQNIFVPSSEPAKTLSVDTNIKTQVSTEIMFGFPDEQYPNPDKYSFIVIQDPDRESDHHSTGKTHVAFKLAENKYVKVAKADLFYSPILADIQDVLGDNAVEFSLYLTKEAVSLNDITDGADRFAARKIGEYCTYLVNKLVSFKIYGYDFDNFARECGSGIILHNQDAYKRIMQQIGRVDDYADQLSYQRNVERASRSSWEGGGFGLPGAIKGAITASALNAATNAWRSVGDSITDSGDQNDIKSKYSEIVNNDNKADLIMAFYTCLSIAKYTFIDILGKKTGWNTAGVLGEHDRESNAKLKNLEYINDIKEKEKILLEILSDSPLNADVIKYALQNYELYDINFEDLIHFVRRVNQSALNIWLNESLSNSLEAIENKFFQSGADRINEIVDYGTALELINDDYSLSDARYGQEVIFSLIRAEMENYGFSVNNPDLIKMPLDQVERYVSNLFDICGKYRVLEVSANTTQIIFTEIYYSNEKFAAFQKIINKELDQICTVRNYRCKSISEAKVLSEEWQTFDSIYVEYNSYADYFSTEMERVISELEKCSFTSTHLKDLIYGNGGLVERKNRLKERESSEDFKRAKIIIQKMAKSSSSCLYIWGSNNFLSKAKDIRQLDLIRKTEVDPYPLVIYDVSEGKGFKGYIVTDNYFYNFNSMLGIGFGDKAIPLKDVTEITAVGKSWWFKQLTGKTDKIKILGMDAEIIETLTEAYNWIDSSAKKPSTTSIPQLPVNDYTSQSNTTNQVMYCNQCGAKIAADSVFCNQCGATISNSIPVSEEHVSSTIDATPIFKDESSPVSINGHRSSTLDVENKIYCNQCGAEIRRDLPYCNQCGAANSSKLIIR